MYRTCFGETLANFVDSFRSVPLIFSFRRYVLYVGFSPVASIIKGWFSETPECMDTHRGFPDRLVLEWGWVQTFLMIFNVIWFVFRQYRIGDQIKNRRTTFRRYWYVLWQFDDHRSSRSPIINGSPTFSAFCPQPVLEKIVSAVIWEATIMRRITCAHTGSTTFI